MSDPTPAIVCLAHLGWDFVWQRPQHVLSRLAQHYPLLYINEPQLGDPTGQPTAAAIPGTDQIVAVQPIFPDRAEVLEQWRTNYTALVQQLVVDQGWARWQGDQLVATRPLIGWFYTPTPVYLLDQMPFDTVVYDVMDELANFKGASADLQARADRLLARADVVFAGGRSLYEARRKRHPNIHLFASGVDPAHFQQALDPQTPLAPELADLPRPIIGYSGVIDERIDLALLDALAEQRPDWSIVLVGPVAKIATADLPRRSNLYYLGQQPYAALPQLLKGFDVCIMPFARNEATRFISPTKTLEYMAAHKPIVSTAVPDVVANYADQVAIADDPRAFVAAIERALSETPDDRQWRIAREQATVARSTWDAIAEAMRQQIEAIM